MTGIQDKRRAIRHLLRENEPADAMAAYYALHHPDDKSTLVVPPATDGQRPTGYVALSRTGIDLFRPLVTMRLPTDRDPNAQQAAADLLRLALGSGQPAIVSAPVRYLPLLRALFDVQSEEQLRLYVLDPVPAWVPTRNRIAQLSHPPKHHLVDVALVVSLLGLSARDLTGGHEPTVAPPRDGAFVGALFESLVTQSLRVYAQQIEAGVGHMRTKGGRQEVDLILECLGGGVIAVEVKLNPVVDDGAVRHLHWLADRMGDELLDAVVVTTGTWAYRRPDGVAVIPAAMLAP